MMNDEARMTNDERSPKLEARSSKFGFRISDFGFRILCFLRHSSFVIRHFSFSHHQLRWLLLLVTGLFSLSGASCPHFLQQYTNPLPRVLPPSPTLEQVIDVVNKNSSRIQSFSTNRASISGKGFPSLTADIAFERPQEFRLRAGTSFGQELDLGSNDELFWFWMKRSQTPGVFYCRHDQFASSQARQMTPFEPRWLIEALGVVEFDRGLPNNLKILPNDRLEIDTFRNTPEGMVAKVTIVDGSQGWILEQHLFDARSRLIAKSITSGHRVDPLSGLVMPTVVQIDCPAGQMSMRIDLGNVEINRLSADRTALWSPPNIPGTPAINMGDPSFQFPSPPAAAATTRRPSIPSNRQRQAR
jgi:hypothetical protein